ncbi:aromatic acid exporter family protein [Clostridium sp.]|jgi:uncharacterized membrane protein YgaE (UPF0421/DUF939 family)|uniref:FUSC family protein n=1 Tax=Clostridium sp. TaxID=1506 RepID=UPI0025831860|nr:aromatic acid exporter family protein [Clostridium sp.]MDF2506141.1 hypothetical protein [Clostridium sp.]
MNINKDRFTNLVGMRNIKTGISVFLCVIVSRLLNLEIPFYACIAAVISMQSSVTSSFHAGRNRMLGTLVGAATGLTFALIAPGNPILCGIGVMIVIFVTNFLKWNKSASIGCIVFSAIMTNLNGRSPVNYSVNRIIDTFVGIGIAVLVNYLIFPPKYLDKVLVTCNSLVDEIILLCGERFCCNKNIDTEHLNKQVSSLKSHIKNYKSDFLINKKELLQVDKVTKISTICDKLFAHINIVNSLEDNLLLDDKNKESLFQIYNRDILNKNYKNTNLNIVYNYHMSIVIDCLKALLSMNITKREIIKTSCSK